MKSCNDIYNEYMLEANNYASTCCSRAGYLISISLALLTYRNHTHVKMLQAFSTIA